MITITATSANVQGSPQQVNLRLVVQATGPELAVEPANVNLSMNIGGVAPTQDLRIRNIGDGGSQSYQLAVTTTNGGNWLKTNKTGGSTDDTVKLTVDASQLGPGTYNGNIRVTMGSSTGSPKDVPVTLKVEATGMVVRPSRLLMVVDKRQSSPMAEVFVEQAVAGSGAVEWQAHVVEAPLAWCRGQTSAQSRALTITSTQEGVRAITPGGDVLELATVPWVILTPPSGVTPRTMQVTLNVPLAPVGEHCVTILVEGNPGTPNRFQGVDTRILVSSGGAWLPYVVRN